MGARRYRPGRGLTLKRLMIERMKVGDPTAKDYQRCMDLQGKPVSSGSSEQKPLAAD